jgi:hypothetical protein
MRECRDNPASVQQKTSSFSDLAYAVQVTHADDDLADDIDIEPSPAAVAIPDPTFHQFL